MSLTTRVSLCKCLKQMASKNVARQMIALPCPVIFTSVQRIIMFAFCLSRLAKTQTTTIEPSGTVEKPVETVWWMDLYSFSVYCCCAVCSTGSVPMLRQKRNPLLAEWHGASDQRETGREQRNGRDFFTTAPRASVDEDPPGRARLITFWATDAAIFLCLSTVFPVVFLYIYNICADDERHHQQHFRQMWTYKNDGCCGEKVVALYLTMMNKLECWVSIICTHHRGIHQCETRSWLQLRLRSESW